MEERFGSLGLEKDMRDIILAARDLKGAATGKISARVAEVCYLENSCCITGLVQFCDVGLRHQLPNCCA